MTAKRRVSHVAVLVETSRGYGREVIEGIVQYVREQGPWHIQFEERGLEDPPPKWLKGWQGDGIISRTATPALERAIRSTGRPRVEMLRTARNPGDVECDHDAVGRMAAEHFVARCLSRFGFFAFGEAAWIRARRDGFLSALAAMGCDCFVYRPPERRHTALPQWEERQWIDVSRWLRKLPQPLGVFCAGDVHAMRLLEVCQACRIAVPEQIAVLGVDNDPVICNMTSPPLSSIDLSARRIGYEAAALLDRKMKRRGDCPNFRGCRRAAAAGENGTVPLGVRVMRGAKTLYIPPSHVVTRLSTDVLAVDDPDLAKTIRYIRQFAHRNLKVSQLADDVGLSRRSLERKFRKCLGRSPKAEILRVQIDRAKHLLRENQLPIEAVARQCGFSALNHFGQTFRRATGQTPRAFRAASRDD